MSSYGFNVSVWGKDGLVLAGVYNWPGKDALGDTARMALRAGLSRAESNEIPADDIDRIEIKILPRTPDAAPEEREGRDG